MNQMRSYPAVSRIMHNISSVGAGLGAEAVCGVGIVTESCPACVKGWHNLYSGNGNCKCARTSHQAP